jgi:Flp pilus assembly pilin Flp
MELIKRFFSEEEGADATEYILVLGLVALAIILGAIFLGSALNTAFNKVGNCVQMATGNTPTACT